MSKQVYCKDCNAKRAGIKAKNPTGCLTHLVCISLVIFLSLVFLPVGIIVGILYLMMVSHSALMCGVCGSKRVK